MESDTKVKALKILNRGPEYYRETIFNRDSGLFRSPHRRSAVELLQETKSLYQKNDSSPQTGQELLRPKSVTGSDTGDLVEGWHSSVDIPTSCVSPTTPLAKPPVPPRRRGLGIQCHVTQSLHNLSSAGMLPGGKDKVTVMTSPRLTLPTSPTDDIIASDSDADACSDVAKVAAEEETAENEEITNLGQGQLPPDLSKFALKRIKYNNTNGLDSKLHSDSDVTPRREAEFSLQPQRSRSRSRTKHLSDISASDVTKAQNSDADLERFFDDMGCHDLDRGLTDGLAHSTASLNSLEGASSLGSQVQARSLSSRNSTDGDGVGDNLEVAKQHGSAEGGRGVGGAPVMSSPSMSNNGSGGAGSIVERNARIIKWLCNVKRANSKDSVA